MPRNHIERALLVLRSANQALDRNSLEQALLDDICQIAIDVGGYRFAWIGYAVDDKEKSVQFRSNAGYHSDYLKGIKIGWGENEIGNGPAGISIKTASTQVGQNILGKPNFKPWLEQAEKYGYQSAISLPLKFQGKAFGCLVIFSNEPDSFDAAEASLLGELAAALSYGVNALRANAQRSVSEAELRTERDTQEVLHKILALTLDQIPLEEKLNRVLELLFNVPWLALERKGSIFLTDLNTNSLQLVAKKYLSPILVKKCAHVAFGNCLCGKAASSRELIFRNHLNHDHETRFEGIQDHGHYCQPILSPKGLVGVLNLYIAAGHEAKPVEAPFLSAVANTLAGLIELEHTKSAQQRLITILDATPDLVTITDTQGNFLYCNDGAKNLFPVVAGKVDSPQSITSFYPADVANLLLNDAFIKAIDAGMWEGEINLSQGDGRTVPFSQLVMAHRIPAGGEVAYFSTVARDISDRKRAELAAQSAALREKNFANTLINSLPGIFYLIDDQDRLIRWNSNLELALGYSSNQLNGTKLSQLVITEDRVNFDKFCKDSRSFGTASIEVNLLKRDSSSIPFFINGVRIDGTDTSASIVGTGIDISYRHQLEQELRARATTDILTGAANRFKMEEAIEGEMQKQIRHPTALSIAMFDIDHFKRINDTYGHDVGDVVLKRVVALARQQLRDIDLLARWGGEEFIILSSSTSLDNMHTLAERVRRAIAEQNIEPAGNITVSFGIGQYADNESQKSLLKRVDDALYLAKNSGRNQVQIAK